MSLPSKRTTASDGGLPGASGVLAVPEVITVGFGRLRSWISHLGSTCALARAPLAKSRTGKARSFISFPSAYVTVYRAAAQHSTSYFTAVLSIDLQGYGRIARNPATLRMASRATKRQMVRPLLALRSLP